MLLCLGLKLFNTLCNNAHQSQMQTAPPTGTALHFAGPLFELVTLLGSACGSAGFLAKLSVAPSMTEADQCSTTSTELAWDAVLYGSQRTNSCDP